MLQSSYEERFDTKPENTQELSTNINTNIETTQRSVQIIDTVRSIAWLMMGTFVDTHAPLMSVGLDSLATIELTQALSSKCGFEISPTILFDHPSL